MEQHIHQFAEGMRRMNRIKVDPARFPPSKQGSVAALPMLSAICTYVDKGLEPLCF